MAKIATAEERAVSFYCTNTGETVNEVYWTPTEGYIAASLKKISWVLRDHRNDKVKLVDPKLVDLIHAMQLKLGTRQGLHVISAYRSPETNAQLRRSSRKVAKNSLHVEAKAVDIRVQGVSTANLKRAAVSLHAGGVGYYPRAGFVHIDTGPVRTWS